MTYDDAQLMLDVEAALKEAKAYMTVQMLERAVLVGTSLRPGIERARVNLGSILRALDVMIAAGSVAREQANGYTVYRLVSPTAKPEALTLYRAWRESPVNMAKGMAGSTAVYVEAVKSGGFWVAIPSAREGRHVSDARHIAAVVHEVTGKRVRSWESLTVRPEPPPTPPPVDTRITSAPEYVPSPPAKHAATYAACIAALPRVKQLDPMALAVFVVPGHEPGKREVVAFGADARALCSYAALGSSLVRLSETLTVQMTAVALADAESLLASVTASGVRVAICER